ncbi:hypothetical protein ACLRDC_15120 [Gluconacetobacter sacchari]
MQRYDVVCNNTAHARFLVRKSQNRGLLWFFQMLNNVLPLMARNASGVAYAREAT